MQSLGCKLGQVVEQINSVKSQGSFFAPRHDHLVRCVGDRDRKGDRDLPAPSPSPGVSGVPQACGAGISGPGIASDHGQLRHSQESRGPGLAGGEPANPRPFHPYLGIVDEPRRSLVRHHRTTSHPPRHLPKCSRAHRQDSGLHQRVESTSAAVHLDKNRRADTRESRPSKNFKNTALAPLVESPNCFVVKALSMRIVLRIASCSARICDFSDGMCVPARWLTLDFVSSE